MKPKELKNNEKIQNFKDSGNSFRGMCLVSNSMFDIINKGGNSGRVSPEDFDVFHFPGDGFKFKF